MTQLEVLQQDLAALTERINSAMAVNENSVTLTRRQLREFANAIQSETIEKIKNEIKDMNLYIEDEVTLDLNGLELEVTVDNDAVLNRVIEDISDNDKVTDEDVQTYLNALEQ
jgi:hypothetical protein